jgi:dTDP-glucose 4,6-dehydratase
VAKKTGKSAQGISDTITYVKDRPGHDRRYAIDCSLLQRELGWKQSVDFDAGLERTVDWYLANQTWVQGIRSGEYKKWIEANYGKRNS